MRFLIAGLGSIGRRHFHNLISLGEKDIVLLRSHRASLPDDELAGYAVETDLQAALKKYDPEAVIIANPTALHMNVAIPAARAGCSLLIEKPISHSLDQIDELEAALEKGAGSPLRGFPFPFHPIPQKSSHSLTSGAPGNPLSFRL